MAADRRAIVAVSTRSLSGPRPTGVAPDSISILTSFSVKSANKNLQIYWDKNFKRSQFEKKSHRLDQLSTTSGTNLLRVQL